MEPHPGRSARLTALATAAATGVLVALRVARDGVQPYGSDGAEYIEHAARLAVREHVLRGEVLNPWRLLTTSDGSFPPLLHLVTLPIQSAEVAAATGIAWMLLLAASVGVTAAAIARRIDVGAAAATGTLLVPAVSGMASRYYYDLPMIALLWAAAAVLVTGAGRRPIRTGVVAGLLFWAAAITKWAALPFGPPILLGALLVGLRRGEVGAAGPKRRVIAGSICAGVCAVLCLAFLAGRSGDNSFAKMGRVAFVDGTPRQWESASDAPNALSAALQSVGGRLTSLQIEDLAFYPLRLGTSIFGVAGLLVVLALGVVWLRRGAPGAVLVIAAGAGHAAFLLGVMPVLDDRFAAVGAPALVVAAALGWGALEPRRRRLVGTSVVMLGLLMAVDFHLGTDAPWNREVSVLVVDRDDFPPTAARGLGASSSTEQRGWARADRQPPRREALRGALWAAVRGCGATGLGLLPERPLLRPEGDLEWARYASLRDRGSPRVGVVCGADGTWEHDVPLDLVAVVVGGGLPRCLDASGWRRAVTVPADDGGAGVDLWARGAACTE